MDDSKKCRGQVYVPRGRRELNEKMEAEEAEKRAEREREREKLKKQEELRLNSRATAILNEPAYRPPPIDESEFIKCIDDDRLASCCLLLIFPEDMSEGSRQREAAPYLKQGALIHWQGVQYCLLVFINESTAYRAMNCSFAKHGHHQPMPLSGSVHLQAFLPGTHLLPMHARWIGHATPRPPPAPSLRPAPCTSDA